MKLNMTIEEALEFADEWSRGMTLHEGSQGWRVVCMLLAEEVRRRAGEQKVFAEALDDAWKVIITVEGENSDEADMLNALQDRMERLSLHARGVTPNAGGNGPSGVAAKVRVD